MTGGYEGRVAIVTGGGGGIGSAAALALARRGAVVVAMDPGVGVQGEPLAEPSAAATVKAIEAEGGRAIASLASVTNREEVGALFRQVVQDFGSLDIVLNTAGILRFRSLAESSEDDWSAVLDVHLNGYLNVLHAALPIMVEAGYGRVVGFTSGAGLARTSGDGLAYGCAKRAVAALTWELGPLLPSGIAVSALSPIAATRMVRGTIVAAEGSPRKVDPRSLDLSAMPQAEDMAPAAAYLADEQAGWCRGRVIYSAGSEISLIAPPTMLEAVRTEEVGDLGSALATLVPVVLVPAETQQTTGGGANPRFGDGFAAAPVTAATENPRSDPDQRSHCLVVADDARIASEVGRAVAGWGMTPVGLGVWQPFASDATSARLDFQAAAASIGRVAQASSGPLDAVVVVLGASARPGGERPPWEELLLAHTATADHVLGHAAWLRAACHHANATGRRVRTVHLTRATSSAGRTAAQAVAQMARSANRTTPPSLLDAFSVSIETDQPSDIEAVGHLVGRLVRADDTLALRGAELAAGRGWIGLRSHPGPAATVSFGGPAIPPWVDHILARDTAAAAW
jgi:NAD(P)-dependent dehydrogenase (short-subunit alcohol dehydrogenase family)